MSLSFCREIGYTVLTDPGTPGEENLKGVAFYEVHVHRKENGPVDSLRAYAEKKVSKIDRLFRTESEANVTFSTERGRFTAEITIKNNGTFFRAHETTSDMYASVDSAVATIERQIRKHKTRLEKRLREGAFDKMAVAEGRTDQRRISM